MKSISLNITGKIDAPTVAILDAVHQTAGALGVAYVVIGATARDLILHYGHGAPIQRATKDVDFAIQVPSWKAFHAVKEQLCANGFTTTKKQHRLLSPLGQDVDIVPFGDDLEDERAAIAWPPDGDVVMSVLGFQEACETADWVRVRDNPELDVPVAAPEGLALLKMIAWTDRPPELRKKDALDVAHLLSSYEVLPEVIDTLYDHETDVLAIYDWDLTLAAAHLLGRRADAIALAATRSQIVAFAAGQLQNLTLERLAEQMCEHISTQYERNMQLLQAFLEGFKDGGSQVAV